jgi:hypothetical protein
MASPNPFFSLAITRKVGRPYSRGFLTQVTSPINVVPTMNPISHHFTVKRTLFDILIATIILLIMLLLTFTLEFIVLFWE